MTDVTYFMRFKCKYNKKNYKIKIYSEIKTKTDGHMETVSKPYVRSCTHIYRYIYMSIYKNNVHSGYGKGVSANT